jgi:hypothetical protein
MPYGQFMRFHACSAKHNAKNAPHPISPASVAQKRSRVMTIVGRAYRRRRPYLIGPVARHPGHACEGAVPDAPYCLVRRLAPECRTTTPTRPRKILWEQTLVAIGCAAVVNRLAHFYLKICSVWIAAASRQIAGEPDSHRVIKAPQLLGSHYGISNKSAEIPVSSNPGRTKIPRSWRSLRRGPA